MKNVFAVKYNKKETHTTPDGVHFVSKKLSDKEKKVIDEFDEKVKKINASAGLPLWMNIVSYVALFISIVLIISLLTILQEKTLEDAFNAGMWMFIVLPLAILIWAFTKIYKKYLTNKIRSSAEVNNLQGEAEKIIRDAKEILGIPETAYRVDTLHYFYEEKGGEIRRKAIGGSQYFNVEMYLYKDEENFYLADLSRVFKIPLKSISGLTPVNKVVSIDLWNKDEAINSQKYSMYKLKTNSTGAIFVRQTLVLSFKIGEEGYEIFFPSYERESLEKVLEIKVSA